MSKSELATTAIFIEVINREFGPPPPRARRKRTSPSADFSVNESAFDYELSRRAVRSFCKSHAFKLRLEFLQHGH